MKEIRDLLFQIMYQNILDYENYYQNVFIQFLNLLKSRNYQITNEVRQQVRSILDENERFIRTLLNGLIVQVKISKQPLKPDIIQQIQEKIWNTKYPDGLTLSERIWKNKEEAEKEFYKVLKKQIALVKSFTEIAYKIQKHMEKLHNREFTQLTKEEIKLIEKLRTTAKAMVKGKITKEKLQKILKQYEKYIKQRKESPYGVKTAHQQLLKNLTKAVEKLSEEAIDDAVKWYMYDKQLYNLKRIARTETANIYHIMIIENWKDNDFVIGYRWKLTPAHRIKDICDEYANVDFGFGKGVFPKDKVPQKVAHPHCTCIIEPVFK
ncbi:MAG: hypothetical protein GXO21_05285 [Aquificae bacterium]|nr:hypothetical protein [Aquificota bacterium]